MKEENDRIISDFFKKFETEIPDEGFTKRTMNRIQDSCQKSDMVFYIIMATLLVIYICVNVEWREMPSLLSDHFLSIMRQADTWVSVTMHNIMSLESNAFLIVKLSLTYIGMVMVLAVYIVRKIYRSDRI